MEPLELLQEQPVEPGRARLDLWIGHDDLVLGLEQIFLEFGGPVAEPFDLVVLRGCGNVGKSELQV